MASRRARLKAVANLPVRRKPSSQDEKPEDSPVLSESKETETKLNEKENFNNETDTNNVAEAIKPVVIPLEQENKLDVVNNLAERNVKDEKKEEKKWNVSPGLARFGRRVKPTVCLPARKERIQTSDADKNKTNKAEALNEEVVEPALTPVAAKLNVNKERDANNIEKVNEVSELVTQSSTNQEIDSVANQEQKDDNLLKSPVVSGNKEIKTPERIEKVITNPSQSPFKVQRLAFLRPNVDLSFRRTDDHKNVASSPRIRNISECSNSGSAAMQNISPQNDSAALDSGRNLASILKRKRTKSNDLTRKMADARREFHRRYEKIKPDRSSLRMIDLIFYNPATNPMVSKAKLEKKEPASDEDELLAESRVDEPEPLDASEKEDYDDEDIGKMPVPQVKIGLNGEIILDEKSLVIETTDAKKGREDLQNSIPVFEDRGSKMSYYCRKSKKSKDWSDSETKRFYKALNTLGTDFLLMKEIFPNRSRLELKNKFKREEKLNRNLIDKALSNPSEFDMTELEKDLADEQRIEEEENEFKLQKKAKTRTMEPRVRTKTSLLAREMMESDSEISSGVISDQVNQIPKPIVKPELEKAKKIMDADMLYEKFMIKRNLNEGGVETSLISSNNSSSKNNLECSNLNVSETVQTTTNFKTRRRKLKNLEVDNGATSKSVESTIDDSVKNNNHDKLEEAMDLSIKKEIVESKKPVKNLKSEKRKAELVTGRRRSKRKKQAPLIYSPDRNEERVQVDEGDEGDLVVTKTITDDDFLQLLAANVKCMKESKIKVQVSDTKDKKIEVIFDEVPPITAKEIEDQNITVLADCNTTICEEESPASPEECDKIGIINSKETSVIVENPNACKKEAIYSCQKFEEPYEVNDADSQIGNEKVMVVINENDQGSETEYQYMLVEEQEVESVVVENIAQNVEIEDEVNVDEDDKNEKVMTTPQHSVSSNTPSIVVCKAPQSESEKMYLAGLSSGSFVLMASDSPNEQKEKRFSMFMISEKSQSDGSSVLSSIPVILPPELVSSLTQEMGCS